MSGIALHLRGDARHLPTDAIEAYLMMLAAHQRGENDRIIHKGWYAAHTEGAITVRRADLVKCPMHDRPPKG